MNESGKTCGPIRPSRLARSRSRRLRTAENASGFGEEEDRFSLDVDVTMRAAHFSMSADNTTNQIGSGSNLCTGPQNCVLKHGPGANATIVSHDRATANP